MREYDSSILLSIVINGMEINMNAELMIEMRRHINRAEDGSLEPDKIDELLDCALECARLLMLETLSIGWLKLRPTLENENGMPFVYVRIDGGEDENDEELSTWITIPPMFAEITANGGYALSAIVPSASAIASQVAQHVERSIMISNANEIRPIEILIVHAYAPPMSFELERTEFLNRCLDVAKGADIAQIGEFARTVTAISHHTPRES